MNPDFKVTYLKQPLRKYTFEAPLILQWINGQCEHKKVLNLFAGPTRLLLAQSETTNDLNKDFPATYHMDALECVKLLIKLGAKFEVIVKDPPYSYRKSMEHYKGHLNSRFKQICDLTPQLLTDDGIIITFGYHSRVMSAKRGFRIRELCIISHGGAQHDTLATVEEKINKVIA